ncbi:Na(+)/H(+) antiporter subunit B [Desulfitibacter alkalitolerans]|uniref:Na(+)/H(+) antiporter subunit B n=1 Tax=Desulfitibacter alkalitolerans TaxID=264641 RepID=UPI0004828254|nr:Na(+)/H(+) antiporter subunit B [Desulfitibacter alkalitolerans]
MKMSKMINNVILQTIAQRALYLILAFSIFLFFAGHNMPGGGFIAGLMSAAAIVLMYVAFGSKFITQNMNYDFKIMIAVGLLIAVLSGMGGMVFGYPFLTQFFEYYTFPVFGKVELASAVIFDLGVYLTVVGSAMTVIMTIGENK